MPLSFGIWPPCRSHALVSSHLLACAGGHWWLALDPSGWASSLCLSLFFAPYRWWRGSWCSSLRPRVFESSQLSPVFFPLWDQTPVSRLFLSLRPSRSRSPLPSLAPSWWSPCPILRRALMTVSCGVLHVPSAFLWIGLVCRSRSPRRPSCRVFDGCIHPLRVVALAIGAFHRAVGSVGAHGIRGGSTCIAIHRAWSVSAILASAS